MTRVEFLWFFLSKERTQQLWSTAPTIDIEIRDPKHLRAVGTGIIIEPLGKFERVPITEPLKQPIAREDTPDIICEELRDIDLGDILCNVEQGTICIDVLDITRSAGGDLLPCRLKLMPVDPSSVTQYVKVRMPVIRPSLNLDDSGAA